MKYFRHIEDSEIRNDSLRRQLRYLKVLGSSALSEQEFKKKDQAVTSMTAIFTSAKLCPYEMQDCDLQKEGLSLTPEIENLMSSSRNYDELVYAWKGWRDATGSKMREHYSDYVQLANEVATRNDFKDEGDLWRYAFEAKNFIKDVDGLWAQVKPLYEEVHTFVGKKLKERFGDALSIEDGMIPAHILGNMWGLSWIHLSPLVTPFPDSSKIDVTKAMKEQQYSVLGMFKMANAFYTSLGLPDVSTSYSEGTIIEKPPDMEVNCHASAWDFCDQKTFKIKMCAQVNQFDFLAVHHEMGHIEYFNLYKDLPIALRNGPTPAFHEAIGDTIALSVISPNHLTKIGLLKDYINTKEASINALMDMALDKVAFLPFALLMEKWRWDVFGGKVAKENWNEHWWKYRRSIQKVKPPVERTEQDFDPGSKFHVAAGVQYISYFVAVVLQFQLYKALCIDAKQYDPNDKDSKPLYSCDFYQSKAAGEKLMAGLSLGASQYWQDVLEQMTGERKVDASALMEYFAPLYRHLKEENHGTHRVTGGEEESKPSTFSLAIGVVIYFFI